MTKATSSLYTLIRRELQEYRSSLVITPFAIAACLSGIMLISVLAADRIAFVGQDIAEALLNAEDDSEITVTIDLSDAENPAFEHHRLDSPSAARPGASEAGAGRSGSAQSATSAQLKGQDVIAGGIDPLLIILNTLMMLVLMAVTANYLLGCLFTDRKDRSILFFKSMPVSDWEQVRAKLMVAFVVAPILFILAALIVQCATVLLSMLLVWRLDMDPVTDVLAHVSALQLLINSVVGWCITALWLAPTYTWLMLASAGAKRTPFLLAVAPVIALFVVEGAFLGTEYFGNAVAAHLPHYAGPQDAVGIYLNGSEWLHIDLLSMAGGLVFSGLAVWLTVVLRRYRFEL